MSKIRELLYTFILVIVFLLLGTTVSKAGNLYLNNLSFEAKINKDGSMDVTETWDIDVSQTNTLYKTFKTDSSKYSGITNVTVKDITSGNSKIFTKANNWAYHVQKNYYYGTKNQDGDFEIGWGVGLDNSRATRKYEISYKVINVITKYNDYAELYWQFIGKDFEVSANKITGTIYLPSNVSNIDSIKVWGHTEGLNGTIYVTDLNKIEFELSNFKSGRYVEIRTLFPTELITSSNKLKNKEILQTVINEETKWADDANAKRKRNEIIENVVFLVWIIINLILIVVYTRKAIKHCRKIKKIKKYKPTTKLEYFRDLPYENSTPGEAVKTLNIKINKFVPNNFGKVFSATLLDLALKGFIDVKQEKNKKGKDIINIYIIKNDDDELKLDEKEIMSFLRDASKGEQEIKLKQLQQYIMNNPKKTQKLLDETNELIEDQLVKDKIMKKTEKKQYMKYNAAVYIYIIVSIYLLMFTMWLFIIPEILFIINAILCYKISRGLNVLTQKGVDYREQWNGLKKYMENFSMLDRREVPELVVWEKYLVYATAFGVADKVIKQLKIVYPNFDELASTNLSTYTYMNLMINTDFNKSFSNAISSSISSTYSSGSGGGGGFSGGGGGGRRPEAADGGR